MRFKSIFCVCLALLWVAPDAALAFSQSKEECMKIKNAKVRSDCCDDFHETCLRNGQCGEPSSCTDWEVKDHCRQESQLCKGKPQFEYPAPKPGVIETPTGPGTTVQPPSGGTTRKVPRQEGTTEAR